MTIALPPDERVLILKVSQGDKAAFRELYEQVSPQLYGVALRLLRRRDLAEDMVQDVFLTLWHAADQYDVSRGSVRTWLSTITRNRCIDYLRRQPAPASNIDEVPLEACAGFDPQQAVLSADDIKILSECLSELNDQQRCAVLLAYFDGSTHQQVAQQMQSPLGSVKTWIRRGLDALKNCMGVI